MTPRAFVPLLLVVATTAQVPDSASPLGPKPGETKVNPTDGQRYVWIPPGKFSMGCSKGDNECRDREKPLHEVAITKGFWLGQTEVTVGAWKRYVQETGRSMPDEPKFINQVQLDRLLNPAWGDEAQPVININWTDADAFCKWATGRLPTEAEWEYSARAGVSGARYGDLKQVAWFADNSGKTPIDSLGLQQSGLQNYDQRLKDNQNGPHRVGQKQPNDWNLYDMLGNVWEWVGDWLEEGEENYQRAGNRDPQGPSDGQLKVRRGGSWYNAPRGVRVSDRHGFRPNDGGEKIGCRCAVASF